LVAWIFKARHHEKYENNINDITLGTICHGPGIMLGLINTNIIIEASNRIIIIANVIISTTLSNERYAPATY